MANALKRIAADKFVAIARGESNGADDFYYDTGGKRICTFDNYEIEGDVVLLKKDNDGSYFPLRLVNCKLNKITFWWANTSTIDIEGCEIRQIVFDHSKIGYVSINSSKVQDVLLEETISSAGLFVGFKSHVRSVRINQKSSIENFRLDTESNLISLEIQWSSSCGNILIEDSEIVGFFEVCNNSRIGDLNIKNSIVSSFALLYTCSAGTVNIWHKSSLNKIDILNSVAEHLRVHMSSQVKSISATQQSNIISVSVKGAYVGYLFLEESIITDIKIIEEARVFDLELRYLKQESKHLTINNSFLQKLNVIPDKAYQISISKSRIWILNLLERVWPRDFIFTVSDTSMNSIQMESFINHGSIAFTDVKQLAQYKIFKLNKHNGPYTDEVNKYVFEIVDNNSEIKVINSDLGKTNFIECRLDEFSSFIFANSKMLDVFIAGTILPYKNLKTVGDKEELEQQRLAFSQFKKIYENRGDVVWATKYHAHEMDAYRNSLRKIPISTFTKQWWNNKGEQFNLWLNRYSSYYGDNWVRAAIVTLLGCWVLFSAYCFCLGYTFQFDNDGYSKFGELFSYSFEFLNPIRKSDFVKEIYNPKEKVPALARVIDHLSRIIMAYLVYQTIAAFRKFGKKSV